MRVTQLINSNGNPAANQFVKAGDQETIFQSYKSDIVAIDELTKTITFGCDWNYSPTTIKHLNTFMSDMFGGKWCKQNYIDMITRGEFRGYKVIATDLKTFS